MQDLVGRLSALDPSAAESLKVISYFDTLVGSEAGLESIVRGAATLAGVPAGADDATRSWRFDPHGDRLAQRRSASDAWPSVDIAAGITVWIERHGDPHVNDALLLERFAQAVAVHRARREGRPHDLVTVVVAADETHERRATAAYALGLGAFARIAVVAPTTHIAGAPSAIVTTPHGSVRAVVLADDADPPDGIVGVGDRVAAAELPESLEAAVLAWRLAPAFGSRVDAADLGVLGAAVKLLGDRPPHADVVAIAALDTRSREVLDALVGADSVRAAAGTLGMHHSTVQARQSALTIALGFDPRSPLGRARVELATLLADIGV